MTLDKQRPPLWEGPESSGPQGGITQSLLGAFLSCRERFKVKVVDGWKAADQFSPRMEYGNMWHVCEEALAGVGPAEGNCDWRRALQVYCQGLVKKYQPQQSQVNDWYEKAKAQFPLYVEWWSRHPDVKDRTPLLQEQVFHVPYTLPSGRVVYLRGKWDAVDLIGTGNKAGIYIQENKTKSGIDVLKIQRQMKFDLQTMMYFIVLSEHIDNAMAGDKLFPVDHGRPVGVRYNVIKRSQHKTAESMVNKIKEDIAANRGQEWFARWKTEISDDDVRKFKAKFFHPVLENLCWWWDEMVGNETDYPPPPSHWRHPFGIYNPMDEGGFSDVDEYIDTGSTVGLVRATSLFGELE